MKPTTILLARHGQTVWNRDGNRYCGSTEVELSDLGRLQAEQLGEALRDVPLAAVYASDLTRAQLTATPAAVSHGLTVAVEPGVRETDFGEFEGCIPADLAVTRSVQFQAWRRDPERTPPPGGGTVTEAARRAVAALSAIAARHPGETVLVVAHNTLNRIVICYALGAPVGNYRRIEQANCCINSLAWSGEDIVLLSANETAHLRRSPS